MAERLGLKVLGTLIVGTLDGVSVMATFGTYRKKVSADLPAPLPFEVSVATKTALEKVSEVFGGEHQPLGDPAFDKVFSVKTVDLDRLKALLNAEARGVLLNLASEGLDPSLNQTQVELHRTSTTALDGEALIEREFREVVRLARALGAAFARQTP